MKTRFSSILLPTVAFIATVGAARQADASYSLGAADNYALLFEGGGTGNTLNQNQGNINGNIGIGGTGKFAATGPGILTGNINFAAGNTGQYSINNTTLNGSVNYSDSEVSSALNTVNALSSTLGGEAGTSISVNLNNTQSQTINASSGTLDGSGNRMFTMTSFQFNNGATLNINGSASDYIVINFPVADVNNPSFGGQITLTGGITSDHLLFNFTGGSNLSGGPSLTINANGAVEDGTFLDPNGVISLNHTTLDGRLFGGDSHDMQVVSGDYVNAPASVPEPSTVFAGALMLLPLGAGAIKMIKRR